MAHPDAATAYDDRCAGSSVGFRERWQRIENTKSYRFVEGGFTIHVGKQGELSKPQIMRSEWVSRRSKAFGEGIGHPHWQMDVLETVRARPADVPVRFETEEMIATEFGEQEPDEADQDLLLGLTIERMHLASAAHWWRLPSSSIANSPANVAELDRWILGCIGYLRQPPVERAPADSAAMSPKGHHRSPASCFAP